MNFYKTFVKKSEDQLERKMLYLALASNEKIAFMLWEGNPDVNHPTVLIH